MAVDGFHEILNIIYISKKLYDMGRYELVTSSFFDSLDYDIYYDNIYSLIANLFEYNSSHYYENQCVEFQILSDPVIVDFYVLAGKYGKCNNISDKDNPYIKAAEQEVRDNLDISHCLDWMLMGHTEPKRPFHSRLGLFISHECGCLDLGVLAYRLVEMYQWFADKCVELKNMLEDTMGGLQISLCEEAMAA